MAAADIYGGIGIVCSIVEKLTRHQQQAYPPLTPMSINRTFNTPCRHLITITLLNQLHLKTHAEVIE